MIKHQLKKGIISLVVTLVILISGYQGYQQWFVEKPLLNIIQSQKDISIQNIEINPSEVQLQLNIRPTYSFINQFPDVTSKLDNKLGRGKWTVTLSSKKTAKLQTAWQEMIFGIKEGIRSGRYTEIQNTVVKIANKYHLSYGLTMDNQYIYLVLRDGKQIWYQLLPLSEVK